MPARPMHIANDEVLARSMAFVPAQRAILVPLTIAFVLVIPWIGWAPLIPFSLAIAAFLLFKDSRVQRRYGVVTSYAAWLSTLLAACAMVFVADGPAYLLAPTIAIPSILASAIFPVRQTPLVGLATMSLVVLTCGLSDRELFGNDPTPTLVSAGLLGAVVIVVGTTRRAETASFMASRIDPLTGAHNRLDLDERLARLGRSSRRARPWAVILGDVDNFKNVNDTWGHVAGDRILSAIARRIEAGLIEGAEVYRFGGEEFLILVTDCDRAAATSYAERICAEVSSLEISPRVTMSLGVATSMAGSPDIFDALFTRADTAMYAAKAAGRNQVVVADEATINDLGHASATADRRVGSRIPDAASRSSLTPRWLEREHLVDVMTNQDRSSRLADLVAAATLIAFSPHLGYWTVVLGLVGLVIFRATQATLPRFRRPEYPFAIGWILAQALIASAVVVQRRGDPWGMFVVVFLVVLTAPVVPRHLLRWEIAVSAILIVATGFVLDPTVLSSAPQAIVSALVLLMACAMVGQTLGDRIRSMRYISLHDSLTGLPNRLAFDRRFASALDDAAESGKPLSMIIADIDHFKSVNDQWGHGRGDTVLVSIASRIQSSLRVTNGVYRVGGEEFAVLLPNTPVDVAVDIAARLRGTVADAPVSGIPVTMSFGVASSRSNTCPMELYASADEALYRAKNGGRNRVICARAEEITVSSTRKRRVTEATR